MNLEQIKANLYAPKVEPILKSDLEYQYRHVCEFIIEQYKNIETKIKEPEILIYLLPCAALPNFEIRQLYSGQTILIEQINTYLNQSAKISTLNLIQYTKNEEDWLNNLILFKHSKLDWQSILEKTKLQTIEQREKFIELYFQNKNIAFQELDFFNYTFEASMDFYTIDQLRRAEHQALLVQDLSIINGYYTPPAIINCGFQSEFIFLIKRMVQAVKELQQSFPQLCKYLIPLAFFQKVVFTININQLQKLKLDIAKDLWERIKKVHPTLYLGFRG